MEKLLWCEGNRLCLPIHELNPRDRLNLVLILSLFILTIALVIIATSPSGATITGDQPPSSGNWVITQPTKVVDDIVYLSGNLTVNSTLTLWNGTIFMAPTEENQHPQTVPCR